MAKGIKLSELKYTEETKEDTEEIVELSKIIFESLERIFHYTKEDNLEEVNNILVVLERLTKFRHVYINSINHRGLVKINFCNLNTDRFIHKYLNYIKLYVLCKERGERIYFCNKFRGCPVINTNIVLTDLMNFKVNKLPIKKNFKL